MRNRRLLIAAALAGTLLSCGQKGPLVLPDAQHPHKKIGKPPATPATPTPSGAAPSSGSAPSSDKAPSPDKAPPPAAPGPAPQP